jgi:hypothetical protein
MRVTALVTTSIRGQTSEALTCIAIPLSRLPVVVIAMSIYAAERRRDAKNQNPEWLRPRARARGQRSPFGRTI